MASTDHWDLIQVRAHARAFAAGKEETPLDARLQVVAAELGLAVMPLDLSAAAPADNVSAPVGAAAVPAPPALVVAPRVLSSVPFGPATAAAAATDALVASAQAEASAKVLAGDRPRRDYARSVADAAGVIVGKLKHGIGRVRVPKIWKKDVKVPREKRLAPPKWEDAILDDYARQRRLGDPLYGTFMAFVRAMAFLAHDARGFCQRNYRWFAGKMHYSIETFRKCLRWSERHGWIGTLGTNFREVDKHGVTRVRRDVNVYQLFGVEDAAQFEGLDEPARVEKRISLTLSRGATLWGHYVWPWGLSSRSPSAPRDRRRTHPAPA